ncbi:hypothetical protein [Dysgonomonas sp. 520]|uniref:hypothetical protein n=1 Tax=Dysgonomonas sp. 520 TaxID=2302931 RepID=UPI0013D1D577|nr:hypothetical protein [Dysgonomonas sp. 520]NDW09762.1 hypothetical protein [Dysgonomonas sp. 520]
MKHKISTLCLLLIVTVSGLTFTQCKRNEQAKIDEFVELMNKDCPVSFNQSTTLVNVESLPEKRVKFNMTMTAINQVAADVAANMLDKLVRPMMIQALNNSPEMKELTALGVTFIFSVKSADNKTSNEIIITPDQYNNPTETLENIDPTASIEDNAEGLLQASVDALKSQLPMTEPNTGIVILECYAEGKTMATVAELPEAIINGISQEDFKRNTQAGVKQMVKSNPGMKALIDNNIGIKYIYKKKDGSLFAEIELTKDSL